MGAILLTHLKLEIGTMLVGRKKFEGYYYIEWLKVIEIIFSIATCRTIVEHLFVAQEKLSTQAFKKICYHLTKIVVFILNQARGVRESYLDNITSISFLVHKSLD